MTPPSSRREHIAAIRERAARFRTGSDRRYLLGVVDDLVEALRDDEFELDGHECISESRDAARALLADLGPDA